ncbi:helix-turn-helix domain-containing protein [Clostridiaceae bacterium 35-E11]
MIFLQDILSEIYRILKKNIVIISNHMQCTFPKDFDFNLSLTEIAKHVHMHYGGYNIYEIKTKDESFYICIQSERYLLDEKIQLVLSMIAMALQHDTSSTQTLKNLLEGNTEDTDVLKLEEEYKHFLHSYVLLLRCPQQDKGTIREIILHSMDTTLIFDYQQNILILSKEIGIEQSCTDLLENILSDLFMECCIAIGGKIHQITDLHLCYHRCLQAFQFQSTFQLSGSVLHYEKMYLYRMIATMDEDLKQSIFYRVFHEKTVEIFDKEMERTMETFFRNNLNLTDTANALFIHRNTLLYRIDKIYHHTGFDLKNVEDSWLLKLAWLIRKEKNISKESILSS